MKVLKRLKYLKKKTKKTVVIKVKTGSYTQPINTRDWQSVLTRDRQTGSELGIGLGQVSG